MCDQPPESALGISARGAIAAARETPAPPLVEEVVALFDQLRDRVLRYVISFGLPLQDAEDVVQEVFLALFQHLQRGRSRRNLRSWTFRVAHNLALRRRGRTRTGIREVTNEAALPLNRMPDATPNPEDQAAAKQQRQRVLAAMGSLPEQDRRCLILRAEGLRFREIAQVLDISLGAVSLSLTRSLTRLSRAAQR